MDIRIPYFVLTIIVGVLATMVPNYDAEYEFDYAEWRKNYILSILLIGLLLISFSAFREISAASIDEYAYRRRFDTYSASSLVDVLKKTQEYVFAFVVWISTRLFSANQGILIMTGSLTTYCFLRGIKMYCSRYSYGIILFMVTCVAWNSYNGIQQMMAAALFFVAFHFLYEKQLWKYVGIVLICTLIHNSAIFLLALYPLANAKVFGKKVWFYNIVFLIIGSTIYRYVPLIAESSGYLQEYVIKIAQGRTGVRLATILVNSVPAALAGIYSLDNESGDRITDCAANIVVLNACIFILASIDTYIARLALYTQPFVLVFLSRVVNYMQSAKVIVVGSVVLYAIVCWLQLSGVTYQFNFVF